MIEFLINLQIHFKKNHKFLPPKLQSRNSIIPLTKQLNHFKHYSKDIISFIKCVRKFISHLAMSYKYETNVYQNVQPMLTCSS